MLRCALVKCRAQLVEEVDRLGRLQWRCPQCERRKAGICQLCQRKVDGKVGVAYYCGPCKVIKRRSYVMKWQRNNLKKVAEGQRRRRWQEKYGRKPPKTPMTLQEAGRLGGKLGSQARIASLGPERVREIALKANAARWAKHRRLLCQTESSSAVEKSPSPLASPLSGKA